MRARHKDAFLKKHNLKLGFMSAFVKASAFALQEQPVVNAGKFPEASVEKTTDLLPHLGVTKAFYSQSMET
jgi:pyruvate/2-oxoglutarate dehydrogenase complex dihydrolipoamide acyltransferase (E2) component